VPSKDWRAYNKAYYAKNRERQRARAAKWAREDRDRVNAATRKRRSKIETEVATLIEKQRWLGFDHSRMAFDAALAQEGVHHAIIDEPFKDVNVDDCGFVDGPQTRHRSSHRGRERSIFPRWSRWV
jgi:hypothetical protein